MILLPRLPHASKDGAAALEKPCALLALLRQLQERRSSSKYSWQKHFLRESDLLERFIDGCAGPRRCSGSNGRALCIANIAPGPAGAAQQQSVGR